MTVDKDDENYLEDWLASINKHLDTVSSKELEERYLAVREEPPSSPAISVYLAQSN